MPPARRAALAPRLAAFLALALAGLVGCDAAPAQTAASSVAGQGAEASEPAPALPASCARPRADVVRDLFCADPPATVHSLADLQAGLRLPAALFSTGSSAGQSYPTNLSFSVVALGHSTALSGRSVSSINPRIILFDDELFVAFTRGVQQVELIAVDRGDQALNFYLVSFEQACNGAPSGCVPGDLYTPQIESDWTRVRLQDDEELKNTPSDCRQCHQRGRARPELLMRELDGPWTHFFAPVYDAQAEYEFPEPTGVDLVNDYQRAKADEPYAGVRSEVLASTIGFSLQRVVDRDQPLVFKGDDILNERWPWSPGGYPAQAQRSATWDAAYAAFKRGEQLALPYVAPRASDSDKLARLSDAYAAYRRGELTRDELPDLSDSFPDDLQTRAEIGLQTEPDAKPVELLIQACGPCHNDVLDQSLSRARFSIALARLDRAERSLAIARLRAPRGSASAMPPKEARQLDDAALARLIDYLTLDDHDPADVDALEHAAQRGMAQSSLPH